MKKRISNIFAVAIILIGCFVLLYPTVSNFLAQKNSSYAVKTYESALENIGESQKRELLEKAREYNKKISGKVIKGDPFGGNHDTEVDEYWEILNIEENGMMGYIQIPKISVNLPIYHGTKERVLQKGIGHWKGTSLPVGGSGTHSVLTGHRGLPTIDLFSDLDQMTNGDVFYLKIMGETLAYQVDNIQTVLPEETESLQVYEGKDYVTLVTCTPYAVNTHRLLVRGVRIPYEKAVEIAPDTVKYKAWIPLEIKAMLAVVACLGSVGVIYSICMSKRRKRNEKRN